MFEEWKEDAERGDAQAQFMLGSFYYTGLYGVQDTDEAILWYKKAAKQGYIEAYYQLGVVYDMTRCLMLNH